MHMIDVEIEKYSGKKVELYGLAYKVIPNGLKLHFYVHLLYVSLVIHLFRIL